MIRPRNRPWPAIAAAITGVAGLALLLAAVFAGPDGLLPGWFTASSFVLGLGLGAMTLLLVHLLTGGAWGRALLPALRAMTATVPLALLFHLPLLAGADVLFPWAQGDTGNLPEAVRHKLAYLNLPFFMARFALCAALWLGLCHLVLTWTAPGEAAHRLRHQGGAAAALIAHSVAMLFFVTDWMMSLEPGFISTIHPVLVMASQAVSACALAVLVTTWRRPVTRVPGGESGSTAGRDIASILFGFLLIWAYLAYMQWLVIWAGDLPHEARWYLHRVEGGWRIVLWLIVAIGFALPFAGFLSVRVKRSRRGIAMLAACVLAGQALATLWRLRPALAVTPSPELWGEAVALCAAASLWSLLFGLLLTRPALLSAVQREVRHG